MTEHKANFWAAFNMAHKIEAKSSFSAFPWGAGGGGYAPQASDFEPASMEEKAAFVPQYKSISYWADAWRRLKKNYVAMAAGVFIIICLLYAFLGPVIVPYTYEQQIRGSENLAPMQYSEQEEAKRAAGEWVFPHVFGTDNAGRDIMVRTMMGSRVSLTIGLIAAALCLIIGTIYGSISGFIGGRTDNIMMRIVDLIYSVPDVLVVLLLSVTLKPLMTTFANNNLDNFMGRFVIALGPSIIAIFIAFALLYWTTLARIIRGQILQLKQQEFVTAARALGASQSRLIRKHLLPNCIGPLVTATCLMVPTAIYLESFLSFLGVGVSAPMTSLGSMASDALRGMYSYAYRLLIPASILSLLILSFNLLGDGLRDALDPKLKR
jgi:oligopeptide transport system permease protein